MLETKRINEVCPCCGLKIKDVLVRFEKGTPVYISGDCVCGYRNSIGDRNGNPVEFPDGSFKPIDEDVIDKWNRVHAEG